ncbi:MAG: AAA family ATPase [Vicinamibacterales bacterium]
MLISDQHEVVSFLASPETHGGETVERIDTHTARVFLAGRRALKLKRAVRYDYLDYSTPARRHAACEAEVRINRRTAPDLYRGVVAVTREPDGGLALGGEGEPVDWLVEMVRFDQAGLFDRLAARRALPPDLMPPLATAIARFHREADRRYDHGGRAGMQWVVDGNADGFATEGRTILDAEAAAALTRDARAAVDRLGDRLDARRRDGFVRQCHGDLHLRNLVLLDGVPTLFDAIEFNDEIACIDVWYDLAFLLMDLWQRDLTRHANAVFNQYLGETDDRGGLPLLPLFLSCRAAVRAKTSAAAAGLAGQADAARRAMLAIQSRRYLALARTLLAPSPPRLVAIAGLSGSGKTTLALGIAAGVGAAPGAVLLRSDELRKRLCGLNPLERLGPDGYAPAVTERVYRELRTRAHEALDAGLSVVIDAVYAKPEERQALEAIATDAGVPFQGFWLEAPAEQLMARVAARTADASDADAEVVRAQLARDAGPVAWRHLDASGPADTVAARAREVLGMVPR